MSDRSHYDLDHGSYTLLIGITDNCQLTVGALGDRSFPAGWYVYNGSAQGPGGFGRIDRHHELSTGDRDTRHWHIDYLLAADSTDIAIAVVASGDHECSISRSLPLDPVPGFGASDCSCGSHLLYGEDKDLIQDAVTSWYADHADTMYIRDSY